LRSLLAAAKQVKSKNGSLLLCQLGGTVEEVFRISGFLAIFKTFGSVEEALKNLA
jgi:anti-anti-sigma factor